jgi:hypothetical protein
MKKICSWLLALAIVFGCYLTPARAQNTVLEYPLYKLPVAPVLDGHINDDPAWKGVPEATGFFKLGGTYTRAKQTWVRAAWRDDAIYLAVRAYEPDIAQLKAGGTDGGDLWSDDGIEIFVRPPGVNDFYHFILNSKGARRGAEVAEGNLNWQAKASSDTDSYTLEIRIPFAIFGRTPKAGEVWRGNFARNIFTTISGGDKFTTWAPLKASFHEWQRFPRWKFIGTPPPADKLAEVEAQLNNAYYDFLRADIAQNAAQSATYVPTLQQAAKYPQFAAANALLSDWEKVQHAQSLGKLASDEDLRGTVALGENLIVKSKKLKYDFLFWQLFNTD